jgi:hypothetical protein
MGLDPSPVEEPAQRQGGAKVKLATLLKVVLGLAFLALGCGAILKWWVPLVIVVQGCLGLFLILAGIVILAMAKE